MKWREQNQVIIQREKEASDLEASKRENKQLQRRLAEVEEERKILHLPWQAVPGKNDQYIFTEKRMRYKFIREHRQKFTERLRNSPSC